MPPLSVKISIHAPAKGATIHIPFTARVFPFQSTLPRRERLSIFCLQGLCSSISIHAPAKGATYGCITPAEVNLISIHAPAKGATIWMIVRPKYEYYFNPRSREGSDVEQCRKTLVNGEISIHAPAKGATSTSNSYSINSLYFNPRSREGSDAHISLSHWAMFLFQSTLPRRERPFFSVSQYKDFCISIHAPAKGATGYFSHIFNASLYFNPRSREGSDTSSVCTSRDFTRFQSTLPRRERPILLFRKAREKCISIHAPAKGATYKGRFKW